MGLRDLFIGAPCLANGLPLITLDSEFGALKDFGLTVKLIR